MAADGAEVGADMPDAAHVLRGRVQRAKMALAAVAGGTVEQAWDMALRRAAQETISLRIDVISCRLRRMSVTEFLEMPGVRSLIGILDGPGEAMGVIVLSPEVLAGLVEVQTVGTVTTHAPMARKPTRTDAAMVAGFFDGALSELDMALTGQPEAVWAAGFRYASFLDDPRPLTLMLEDARWQVAEAEVSLAGGAKTGRILLALPAVGRGAKAADVAGSQVAMAAKFTADLREQLDHATVMLEGVLGRIQLDLAALMALGVEDVLPLFGASLDTVQLEASDGRRLATARLGQARGMRALRILRLDGAEPDAAVVDPQMAAAQAQFTPRGEMALPMTMHLPPADISTDPTSMSDLVSNLMSDLGDTQFPPMVDAFDRAGGGMG